MSPQIAEALLNKIHEWQAKDTWEGRRWLAEDNLPLEIELHNCHTVSMPRERVVEFSNRFHALTLFAAAVTGKPNVNIYDLIEYLVNEAHPK